MPTDATKIQWLEAEVKQLRAMIEASPAAPKEDANPSKWTVTHNGKSVTADTLFKAMAAAQSLRTDEEQRVAAENLLRRIGEEMAEEVPAAPSAPAERSRMKPPINPESLLQLAAIYVQRDGIEGLEKLRQEIAATPAAPSAPAVSVTDEQLDALVLVHGFVFDEDECRYHFTAEGLRALLALSPQAESGAAKIALAEQWDAGYAQGREEAANHISPERHAALGYAYALVCQHYYVGQEGSEHRLVLLKWLQEIAAEISTR